MEKRREKKVVYVGKPQPENASLSSRIIKAALQSLPSCFFRIYVGKPQPENASLSSRIIMAALQSLPSCFFRIVTIRQEAVWSP
jgi:hypothetical protein